GLVQIWDCALRRSATNLQGHIAATYARFSPDGRLLISAGIGEVSVKIWEAQSWKLVSNLMGEASSISSIKAVALTPDGQTFVTGSEDSSVRFWDLTRRRSPDPFREASAGVLALAISPDGKTLAVGGRGGVIRLWNLATHRELFELHGHRQSVTSLAFS